MASGGSERAPQFTSSHYEIPSWQVPWNKPWYQCVANESPKNPPKYNSRGHDVNCNCARCEEDLETAFTPQVNVNNRQADILNIPNGTEIPRSVDAQREESQKAPDVKPAHAGRKVLLFSELPEVQPQEARTESSPIINEATSSSSPDESSNSNGSPSTEALIDSVASMGTIATISDRTKNVQARIEQLSEESSVEEFVTLRSLLVACIAQLNRIDSTRIRWLEMAKNMSLNGIRALLAQLEEKLKGRGVDLDEN